MNFYIEIVDNLTNYRLQTDGTWRKITSTELTTNDFQTNNIKQIEIVQQTQVEGILKSIGIESPSRSCRYQPYAMINKKPQTPTKEQLKTTIALGDDSINNTLRLKVDGLFYLEELGHYHI